MRIDYPDNCPECGTVLVRVAGEANHYCPNRLGCPPQIKGRIQHFISKKALDIDSLGEQTISQLFENKLARTPADLYDLSTDQILQLEGFKEASTQKLIAGIRDSTKVAFPRVLFGLGIRYVGATVAEKLCVHFKNIDNLLHASRDKLLEVPEIGERIADSVLTYFSQEENLNEIQRLRSSGIQFELAKAEELKSDILGGKSFVISGVFSLYGRDELKAVIKENGGRVVSSISAKLDYLVAGDNMGPAKLEKAVKLNIDIINEQEFKKLIGQN